MPMPRPVNSKRRSATEWAGRGGLALAAALLGYVGVTHSLAQAVRQHDPAFARRLSPSDGRITALLAARQLSEGPTGRQRQAIARTARLAADQDATASSAFVTLGLLAQMQPDAKRARRLFAYAEGLSRRDFGTQLWAIEDAVTQGNVAAALLHYDIALRTSRTAPDLLYPVLAKAVADPAVRPLLTHTLARRPPWATSFVAYVAGVGIDPRSVASLLTGLLRAGGMVPPDAVANTINALVAHKSFDDAWQLYAIVRSDVDRRRSRDVDFAADLAVPSILDWAPVVDAGVVTSIQRGSFDFSVIPSADGPLLRQLQLLPPGNYILSGHSSGVEQDDGALPYWALTCLDGRELGRIVVPSSTHANGDFNGRLDVPQGCDAQMLSLVAKPSDRPAGTAGQIDRVSLAPLAR